MSPEQINTILEQHQKLLEQNQQLIGMLTHNKLPDRPPKPVKRANKKERIGTEITQWYFAVHKKLPAQLSNILLSKLQNKGLWQG